MNALEKKRHLNCSFHVRSLGDQIDPQLDTLLVLPSAEQAGTYKFVYDYPLDTPAEFEHAIDAKTTVTDLMKFGKADYVKIYAEEDATTPVPAQDSQQLAGGLTLMNRTRTKGKYGIWGHVLNDLYFEGVTVDLENKKVTFDIGS